MSQGLLEREHGARRFWLPLGVLLALCLGVGGLGGAVTSTSVNGWYQTLSKPSFNPPDWLFAPVWTTLFVLMALAAALVWQNGRTRERRSAMIWFLAQLAVNLAWPCLFFGLQSIGLALACLILLWAFVAATALHFWAVDPRAGLLMIPYLGWVGFAGLLNFVIWRLN